MKFTILLLFLIAAVLVSLITGPSPLDNLSSALLQGLGFAPESYNSTDFMILWEVRVPRTLAALLVGASLSLCGSFLQTLTKNPLADPYTLGLAGSASFGAIFALIFGFTPPDLYMPSFAIISCLLTSGFLVLTLGQFSIYDSQRLVLTGMMISLFFGSLVVLLTSLLKPQEIQLAIFWMMGQIGTERDKGWLLLAPTFCVSFFWALKHAKEFDRLLLGHEVAFSLGTSYRKLTLVSIAIVAILVSMCVNIAGLIGFVGLLAPHLTRVFLKSQVHHNHFIGSALVGANLLLVADIISRMIGGSQELPTGGLVAVLGAPTLIYLLHKTSSAKQDFM